MIQVWILIGVTIFFLVCLVGYQELKIKHLQSVIAWCDERERKIKPLYTALDAIRKARLPITAGAGIFQSELFMNGMPSKVAVDRAAELLMAADEQMKAMRTVYNKGSSMAKAACEDLVLWEHNNPVPEKNFPV